MKKAFLYIVLVSLIFFSCDKKDIDNADKEPTLNITPTSAPFSTPSGSIFYSNVSYDSYPEDVFDIFMPSSATPTSLVIQIHGGGFKTGDKADGYNSSGIQNEVNSYLSSNIAYATLNYRLLLDVNEQEGVLKPLNDCKRALQFIRYYCKTFNINKAKVVLKGGSAGAGTSLWIGLSNDMADPNSSDPILKESTRIKAIVASNTQATYDLLRWPTEVFSEYQTAGLSSDSMLSIATMETFLQFYGIKDTSALSTPKMIDYRAKVNMLGFITSDDPEIYLASAGIPYTFPANKGNLLHHPLHAKAIMDRASQFNVKCKALIPEMGINTTNGESTFNFVVRKLNE